MNDPTTGKELTLHLKGKIDSGNAADVEKELRSACGAGPQEALVLDAEELVYISSAGLRVVLRLLREHPGLKIINASNEVYDILEMTGFTEMMTVSKACRRLSVDGCELIGQGANGLVYRLDPETVIKVYRDPDCLQDIRRERELARKAFVLGIPTAIPYDVVRVGQGYGSVFELLNARSLAQILQEDPGQLAYCAHISAELMKTIHATELKPGELPDERQTALERAGFLKGVLPDPLYEKLHRLIADIPAEHHLLHGDLHLKNIMIQNGETLLIDMDTLSQGHPVFELASLYTAYQGFGELDERAVTGFLGIPYAQCGELLHRIITEYSGRAGEAACQELLDKARVLGYMRMMRRAIRRSGDTEAGRRFIAHCGRQLAELLPRMDSLTF